MKIFKIYNLLENENKLPFLYHTDLFLKLLKVCFPRNIYNCVINRQYSITHCMHQMMKSLLKNLFSYITIIVSVKASNIFIWSNYFLLIY